MPLQAGSAVTVINCEIGDDLSGQFHRRLVEYVRDNLEANAFYLTDDKEKIMLINLDLAGLLETNYVREVCGAIETATGVPARSVILCSTHTHEGPDTLGLLLDAPKNEAYLTLLKGWLVETAKAAVASVRPARVGWAAGEARIGYNRRLCWADGSHSMYGDATRPDFTGLEGPDDPSHTVLFAIDESDKPIAILHSNCCHAVCMEQATFISADFPGEARAVLRAVLGEDLPVLYLQGASGDTSPRNQIFQGHHDGERRAKEIGALLAAETLRLIYAADTTDSPIFRHAFEDVKIDIRLPDQEAIAHARKMAVLGEEKAGRFEYINSVSGVLRLYETYKDDPVELLAVHAIRIGNYAVITNPCELYCQFGLDIKRRSPAAVTAVAQLADGFSGYCPTIPALMGGGYSASAIYWCRLETNAGYKLVEASSRLLHKLWFASREVSDVAKK